LGFSVVVDAAAAKQFSIQSEVARLEMLGKIAHVQMLEQQVFSLVQIAANQFPLCK
jgi:hypothetical protein